MFQICKHFSFDAAHQLRNYSGKCANLHGHRWEVDVCVEGDRLDNVGMLIDFGIVKVAALEATVGYDHSFLNEIPPFTEVNPTAEYIAQTIYHRIRDMMHSSAPHLRLAYVQVWETANSFAKYWE